MKMLYKEWRNLFSNKLVLISLIVISLVPLLYNSFFLSSFWDPYGKISDLPVAVINNDTGAIVGGKQVNIGSDFVNELKSSNVFKWRFSEDTEKELNELNKGKIYMVIEVPENFSQNAATLLDQNPEKMKLNYFTNPGHNYAASQMVTSAISKMEIQVADEVRKQYSKMIFESMESLATGFQQASEGSQKLGEGALDLVEGTKSLNENTKKLADRTETFNEGMGLTHDGTEKLVDGITNASDNALLLSNGAEQVTGGTLDFTNGVSKLEQGLSKLDSVGNKLVENGVQIISGSSKLTNGLLQSSKGIEQFQESMNSYISSVDHVKEVINSLQRDSVEDAENQRQIELLSEQMKQLSTLGAQLTASIGIITEAQATLQESSATINANGQRFIDGVKLFHSNVEQSHIATKQLVDAIPVLQNGMQQMATNTKKLSSGLVQLKQGGDELESGIEKLRDAGLQFQNGTVKLAEGTNKLQVGIISLASGVEELSNGLTQGASQTSGIDNVSEPTYDMFASPTELVSHVEHEVSKYGMSMAPYVISIGLFACAMMFSTAYKSREASMEPKSAIAWFISKYTVVLAVSILGSVLSILLLLEGFHLEVQSVWRFSLFTIIVAVTFMTLVFLLSVALGQPGQFLGFIILLMQVSGSEGTFPLALTPKLFQNISNLLPMTYAIRGFRQVISIGTDYGYLWTQAGILGGYILLFVILLILSFKQLTRGYTKKQLIDNSLSY